MESNRGLRMLINQTTLFYFLDKQEREKRGEDQEGKDLE